MAVAEMAVTTAITATARQLQATAIRAARSQNGHQAGHTQAPRQDAAAGEPNGIGNVTFLQRPNEPRRNAGHRAPR